MFAKAENRSLDPSLCLSVDCREQNQRREAEAYFYWDMHLCRHTYLSGETIGMCVGGIACSVLVGRLVGGLGLSCLLLSLLVSVATSSCLEVVL